MFLQHIWKRGLKMKEKIYLDDASEYMTLGQVLKEVSDFQWWPSQVVFGRKYGVSGWRTGKSPRS